MRRSEFQRIFVRYLDAFLPDTHPVMQDLALRRKLRIIMGVGAVVTIIFATRAPLVYDKAPDVSWWIIGMCLFFVASLWIIIKTRARYFLQIGFAMVIVATGIVIVTSYEIRTYPPVNLPYVAVMVILLHFLYGRWVALFALVFQMLAHFPLLFASTTMDSTVVMHPGAQIPVSRLWHFVNVMVAGTLVWLISEAYDQFRNESEFMLQRLQTNHRTELEFARTLQQELLPLDSGQGPYRFAGMMRPAAQVGGDYFDVLQSKKYTWFAIGDVTGHGVQAGLLVMQVRTLLHYCINALGIEQPARALIEINNSFFDSIKTLFQKSFMTFVLLRMDRNGNVLYAGSHLRIIVYRKDGKKLESYPTQGFWLGVNRLEPGRERNLESSMRLQKGDLLILYTDGFTEARNARGDQFGIDGLYRAIGLALEKGTENLSAVQTSILNEFQRFVADQELEDDLTLLTVRRSS